MGRKRARVPLVPVGKAPTKVVPHTLAPPPRPASASAGAAAAGPTTTAAAAGGAGGAAATGSAAGTTGSLLETARGRVAAVTSLKLARKLTSKFHALLNEEAALLAAAGGPGSSGGGGGRTGSGTSPLEGAAAAAATAGGGKPRTTGATTAVSGAARTARLAQIADELARMGGREAYQEASALATRAFRSSRFVFKTLVGAGLQPVARERPLAVLEIGAVNAQLKVSPWLRVRAIDLTSRDPAHIEAVDFFDIPVADAAAGEWDVIVNAMVINCVPDPVRRGEMLLRCHDHLVPGGLMFFALPSRCIDMSEFTTRRRLEALLRAIGFTLVTDHRTPKISFYVLQRTDGVTVTPPGGRLVAASQLFAAGSRRPWHPKAPPPKPVVAAGSKRRARPADEDEDSEGESSGEDEHDSSSGGEDTEGRKEAAPRDAALAAAVTAFTPAAADALQARLAAKARAYAAVRGGVRAPAGRWTPVLPVHSGGEAAAVAAFAPPVRTLPPGELPHTGFSRTDFSIVVPAEWVRLAGGGGERRAGAPAAAAAAAAAAAGGSSGAAAAPSAPPPAPAAESKKPHGRTGPAAAPTAPATTTAGAVAAKAPRAHGGAGKRPKHA